MSLLIFDTSVWVDFLKGTANTKTNLLEEYIENDYRLFTCPTIVQEVLQGIKEDTHFRSIKEIFLQIDMLSIDSMQASIGAAELYRTLRKKGATIRKSNDCLIAFYALYYDIPIVHNDRDFDIIAKHSPLKIRHT